jgi:hypothetical protein
MTLRANARLAGLAFLLNFVTGIGRLVLFSQVSAGDGTAARLASIAQHPTLVRVTALLVLLEFLYQAVLAVTLYALTRDQDRDLALLATGCRLTEGVIAAVATGGRLDLLAVSAHGRRHRDVGVGRHIGKGADRPSHVCNTKIHTGFDNIKAGALKKRRNGSSVADRVC